MPRSCAANSAEKLFNADEHIVDLWQDIAKILFITGLEPSNFDNYELDHIIAALRQTFSTKDSGFGRDPAYAFIYCNYGVLISQLRNAFFYLQVSKYGKQL